MTDWIARLYVFQDGKLYRIKVFEKTVGIERQQPTGGNELFNRDDFMVYSLPFEAWEWNEVDRLIQAYEHVAREASE